VPERSVSIVAHGRADDPWVWSGTLESLRAAFEELGLDAHRLSADDPQPLNRLLTRATRRLGRPADALNWLPPAVALRTRALRDLPLGDLVLQLDPTFALARVDATYEDMTIAHLTGLPRRLREPWLRRHARTQRRARVNFAASRWAADSLVRDVGLPAAKVAVVGMGANVVCEPQAPTGGPPRFLWVGVEWERKNGARVVEAFSQLGVAGAELHLVGKHPAIDLPGVVLHGEVRDHARLRALFESSTALVMPSQLEPYGIVYCEAATAGVPSIGTIHGGAADAIGKGGILVDPDDPRQLLEAMRAMSDPAVRDPLSVLAVEHGRWVRWTGVAQRMLDALDAAPAAAAAA
jgi:glycosyltransferase involved in cell wall biosynthesis